MATTLDPSTNTNSGTLSNANLSYAANGVSGNVVRSTLYADYPFYFEYDMTTVGNSGFHAVGVVKSSQATATPTSVATVPAGMYEWRSDAIIINNGTSSALGNAATSGNVLGIACHPPNGNLWFRDSTGWFGGGDPALGTSPAFTGLSGTFGALINMFGNNGSPAGTINFGDSVYAYTRPANFNNIVASFVPFTPWTQLGPIMAQCRALGRAMTGWRWQRGIFVPA